ncbi:MAG: c-type cytochrome, partial [Phycisphaerae bacterium]
MFNENEFYARVRLPVVGATSKSPCVLWQVASWRAEMRRGCGRHAVGHRFGRPDGACRCNRVIPFREDESALRRIDLIVRRIAMPLVRHLSPDHEPARRLGRRLKALLPGPCLLMLCMIVGCGTNLDNVLYQTLAATGRTYLDLLLTDAANNLADAREDQEASDAEDDTGDDAEDDGEDDGTDEHTGGDGTAVDGAALFSVNCAACHGDDGASGFAPDITGKSAAELAAGLALPNHNAISLTDEEVSAIAQFLGGGSPSTGPTGDPAAGEDV